jgi:hypothetical protein
MDISLLARINYHACDLEYEIKHTWAGRLLHDPKRVERERDRAGRFLFSHMFGDSDPMFGDMLNRKIMFFRKPQNPEKELKTYAKEIVHVHLRGLL